MGTLNEFLHKLVDHVGAGSLHTEIDEIEEPKAQPSAQQSERVQSSNSPTSDPANQTSTDLNPRRDRGEADNQPKPLNEESTDGGVTDTGDGTGKHANPAEGV